MIRHALEIHRSSGSARLIPLVISNASIVDIGKRGVAAPSNVCRGRTVLLFPGGVPIARAGPIDRLVVLDGSWGQARRMRYRLECLSNLRTVTIPAPGPSSEQPPRKTLRKPRYSGELPTALAVAEALKELGDKAAAVALDNAYTALYEALKRDRGLL